MCFAFILCGIVKLVLFNLLRTQGKSYTIYRTKLVRLLHVIIFICVHMDYWKISYQCFLPTMKFLSNICNNDWVQSHGNHLFGIQNSFQFSNDQILWGQVDVQ